jgi:hypothetical protein
MKLQMFQTRPNLFSWFGRTVKTTVRKESEIMKTIWKDVPDYEGLYQVSNYGEVMRLRSYDSRGHLRNSRIIRQTKDADGYMVVGLHKDGKEKKYLVHRLVALTFLNNPYNYTEVNHIDEIKTNNIVSNLEWCSHKYNVNYGTCQTRRVNSWRKSKIKEMILCVERNY